jgi:hypothetical protein
VSELELEAFVTELDRLGLRLTALQLADGKFKIYRWRMRGAHERAKEIEALWKSQIGEDQSRIDLLAAHIMRAERIRSGNDSVYATKQPKP